MQHTMLNIFKPKGSFDYRGIEPPPPFKPFCDMDAVEAQRHFEWFISQSEPRRRLLLEAVEATGGEVTACDYTPPSLVPLWGTMSGFFQSRPMTLEEEARLYDTSPAAAQQAKLDLRELTTATACLALDIGFYVAEVYMRLYPQVRWLLCTKRNQAFNKPILTGFKLPLVPSDMVIGSVWKHLATPRDTLLFDIYRLWEQDVAQH